MAYILDIPQSSATEDSSGSERIMLSPNRKTSTSTSTGSYSVRPLHSSSLGASNKLSEKSLPNDLDEALQTAEKRQSSTPKGFESIRQLSAANVGDVYYHDTAYQTMAAEPLIKPNKAQVVELAGEDHRRTDYLYDHIIQKSLSQTKERKDENNGLCEMWEPALNNLRFDCEPEQRYPTDKISNFGRFPKPASFMHWDNSKSPPVSTAENPGQKFVLPLHLFNTQVENARLTSFLELYQNNASFKQSYPFPSFLANIKHGFNDSLGKSDRVGNSKSSYNKGPISENQIRDLTYQLGQAHPMKKLFNNNVTAMMESSRSMAAQEEAMSDSPKKLTHRKTDDEIYKPNRLNATSSTANVTDLEMMCDKAIHRSSLNDSRRPRNR